MHTGILRLIYDDILIVLLYKILLFNIFNMG